MTDAALACLHSEDASLVLERMRSGAPAWRHLGARTEPGTLPPIGDTRGPASFSLDQDVPLTSVPPAGLGWFGPALVTVRGRDFVGGECAVEASERRLSIVARDEVSGLAVEQIIERLDGGAFRLATALVNEGDEAVTVDRLATALLPLPAASQTILSWRGRHNAELSECREAMPTQGWVRETRRGLSGHGGPPGLYVLAEGATWDSGLVVALQLAWSGDSRVAVERDDEGRFLLTAEAMVGSGEIVLAPGERFEAPDALLAISVHGRNGAMMQQHAAVRSLLRWPGGSMRPRPVHLNSWEACYFDHDQGRIERLAEAAAAIGIERFVLDDGWFRGRRDDTAGLGDWTPDPATYPDNLRPLTDKVAAMGMEFGLWVEPEMANPDSDLLRDHPDWALASEGRGQPTARNQLVLDMARDEVRDHLFGAIDKLLSDQPISYLKWDHNRDLAPAGGVGQVRGTYDLLARLRAAHPGLEIEGCAGGGGRSDAGLAPFVHRFWASDTIDAVSRVAMQRGFLAFLPPEMMGAHIGASPAHATGRTQSLGFRAAVAIGGHLGVELDPEAMSEQERGELAHWIAFYKDWRDLLHGGQTRLGEGADGLVWQAQGNGREWLLTCLRTQPAADRRPQPLTLPFATNDDWDVQLLRIADGGAGHRPRHAPLFDHMAEAPVHYSGSWLANAGLPLPPLRAETAAIFHLTATA